MCRTLPRSRTGPGEPNVPPTLRSTAAPSPASAQRATASGSTQLAQIADASPDASAGVASSRPSMNATSPAPPAVGLSPESLMKNGRSADARPRAMHASASPAAVLKSNRARASQYAFANPAASRVIAVSSVPVTTIAALQRGSSAQA